MIRPRALLTAGVAMFLAVPGSKLLDLTAQRGPIVKDKLFFFAGAERRLQEYSAQVPVELKASTFEQPKGLLDPRQIILGARWSF